MKTIGIIILLYGLLITVGGVIGHFKAASQTSLITGIVFGAALLITSIFVFKGQLYAAYTGLILTVILDAFFTYRFIKTMTFMPAGFLSLISLGVLVSLALLLRKV